MRCGGTFNKHFAVNLPENLTVKTFENWLRIDRTTGVSLVFGTQCTCRPTFTCIQIQTQDDDDDDDEQKADIRLASTNTKLASQLARFVGSLTFNEVASANGSGRSFLFSAAVQLNSVASDVPSKHPRLGDAQRQDNSVIQNTVQ